MDQRSGDGWYEDYQAFKQPAVYRTWPEALRRQRRQFVVLLVLEALGVIVFVTYGSFPGGLILTAAGVSLLGTLAGARYQP